MGAAKEVGRSAFLVNCDHTNILMDYGVLLKREPIFPMHIMPKELDAVVITHAHLDHSGFVPSLYLSGTGDINTRGSKLLRPADLDFGEIDMMITESTYSQTEQQPREEAEKDLIEYANDVIERGGTLFIPSFSVERAQEIACVLKSYNFKHKVVMDGMALKANQIMSRHPAFLKDPDMF